MFVCFLNGNDDQASVLLQLFQAKRPLARPTLQCLHSTGGWHVQVMMHHAQADYEDNENCDDNDICSIGWIKSPEDTESFKLSINAPSAKVVLFNKRALVCWCADHVKWMLLLPIQSNWFQHDKVYYGRAGMLCYADFALIPRGSNGGLYNILFLRIHYYLF